jgi:lysophospholipase L1-like esterase
MSRRTRVVLIGDSQAEALWPRVQKALPGFDFPLVRFQRGWAEWGYKNEGKLQQQLADAKPDLVVIELGGNNATLNAGKYQANVDWMLDVARASGASHILYLGPAAATKEPFKSNKEWTRTFQSGYLPLQERVTWMDSFPHTQTGQVDGVHFSGSTYGPWSAAIARQIEKTSQEQASSAAPSGTLLLAGGTVLVGSILTAYLLSKLLK